MTADLYLVPRIKGAQVSALRPPSDDARLRGLRWIAQQYEMADADVRAMVAAWADPRMSAEERDIAWRGYVSAVEREQDVRSGLITPHEVCDELTCPDRYGAACQIAEDDAEEALAVLAGTTTNRGTA